MWLQNESRAKTLSSLLGYNNAGFPKEDTSIVKAWLHIYAISLMIRTKIRLWLQPRSAFRTACLVQSVPSPDCIAWVQTELWSFLRRDRLYHCSTAHPAQAGKSCKAFTCLKYQTYQLPLPRSLQPSAVGERQCRTTWRRTAYPGSYRLLRGGTQPKMKYLPLRLNVQRREGFKKWAR